MRIKLITLSLLLMASTLPAQVWMILQVTDDLQGAVDTISEHVADGYTPVGFELSEEEGLWFLLVKTTLAPSSGWQLVEASSSASATAEFTDLIRQGYLIMDVSIVGDRVVGLFSRSPATVFGWRIIATPRDFVAVTGVVSAQKSEGYTAWGVSQDGQTLWHLFLDDARAESYDTMLVAIPTDEAELVSAMTVFVADRWTPWGLAVADGEFLVRFIRRRG